MDGDHLSLGLYYSEFPSRLRQGYRRCLRIVGSETKDIWLQ